MSISAKTLFNQISEALKHVYDERATRSLATILLAHFAKASKTDLLINKEVEWNDKQAEQLSSAIQRLQKSEPIQYILGEAPFFELTFKVSPGVLIPRPETEELVQLILQNDTTEAKTILDIGTGSGCIPISIKKNWPLAEVHSMDISQEALAIAQENAQLIDANIHFHHNNILLQPDLGQKFDIIVSNPPYVTEKEKNLMETNVLEFEPHLALFVPDNDALKFYEAIADFALKNLNQHSLLYFEINEHYGNETVKMLSKKGFRNIGLIRDIHDKDRMIKAEL